MTWLTLGRLGLILNFIGTVLVAVSFGRNLGGAYQEDPKGQPVYLASFVAPRAFQLGLVLLAIGFVLQLFE